MQLSEENMLCKAHSFSSSMHEMSAGMRCREKRVSRHNPPMVWEGGWRKECYAMQNDAR